MFEQTLDALTSHLLTPFNRLVPPSNLLDKIACRVAEVKGPVEWPHSQRATRAKIGELTKCQARDTIAQPLDSKLPKKVERVH